ncbi:MAG TPA: PilZ domain-containing protein [bacterium]|nr:PilZ domain-containing protein [bacterium]
MGGEWEEIKQGQSVELSVSAGGNVAQFSTSVHEKTDAALVLIMPHSEQAEKILVKDGVVEATISLKDEMLKFTTLILERKHTKPPLLLLMRPHEVHRVSSRSFYRLQVVRPLKFRLLRDPVTPISEFKAASTLDLSGGGLMIQSNKKIERDQLVEVNIDLGAEIVNAVCSVTITKTEIRGMDSVFLTGLEFLGIEERERDKIVKFIFDSQRQLKKKGIMM